MTREYSPFSSTDKTRVKPPLMALPCFPPKSSPFFLLFFSSSSSPPSLLSPSDASRRASVGFAVYSSHSNPRILKSSRRSRTGRRMPSYDEEDDEEDESAHGDEEIEEEEALLFDDQLSYVEGQSSDQKKSKVYPAKPYINRGTTKRIILQQDSAIGSAGYNPVLSKGQKNRLLKTGQAMRFSNGLVTNNEKIISNKNCKDYKSNLNGLSKERVGLESNAKQIDSFSKSNFQKLAEELDFDEKWFPLIEYLSTFGLKDSHFISIYERHMPCLQINLSSAKERLDFLLSVGVKHRDIKRILVRQPQILEYTVENNLKSHVAFLLSVGVPQSRVGQIITAAPSLFSYSVEHSLKPTIRYLVEEVGIKTSDISKVVQLSPQILVQRIDSTWTSRFIFLSKELGAPKDSIVKMVTKHPQLLHYSIEDGILPRINFLRSIGMRNSDILKVLTSLTQVLSLSLEGNLKPKYLYLVNELRNEVKSLTKYPMYLSLSLEQRIRPRHRFLVSLKKAPKGPFPLSSLVPSDESFCQQWAGTSLDKYLAFRQSLLMTDFAKKYKREV